MQGITTVLRAPNEVEQVAFEVPDAPVGGLMIRMLRANVCGTEVHVTRGEHPLIGPGCVLGHEGVGEVFRLGTGVDRDFKGEPLMEGDRVVATYFQECRRCPECNSGHPNLCRNAYAGWSSPASEPPHFHGTFGSHYSVGPGQYVYKVPSHISSKAVSSANCALSQAYAGCEVGGVRRGDKVIILGAGGLGLCASAIANASGAEVFVAELSSQRLQKAEEFGAHHAIDLASAETSSDRIELMRNVSGGGADVVIDMTGVPSAFSEAVASTRPGGVMVSIGSIAPNRFTQFDPGAFTRSGVQIRASIRYPATTLGKAVKFIGDTPQFPWEDLVDRDFSFDDAALALRAADDREVTRASLVMSDG